MDIPLTIGLISFVSSLIIFYFARKAEIINRGILNENNKAIKEWHGKIMDSAVEMLTSKTEIIVARSHLKDIEAKYNFLNSLKENIRFMIEHLPSDENTRTHLAQLSMILKSCEEIMKSNLPPEILEKYIMRNQIVSKVDTQKNEVKDDPSQPPKE
jgi:hypothetical protein